MTPAGVHFSDGSDGDLRSDTDRAAFAGRAGIPFPWATVTQVHGPTVVLVERPGGHGEADGLITTTIGLPLAVLTADCVGVVVEADGAVGVAHAGWRGVAAGIVEALLAGLVHLGTAPLRAEVGPAIGPCCYEVGPEVVTAVGHPATTREGTPSVDLVAAVVGKLDGVPTVVDGRCTRCDQGLHSHRRDGTAARLAAVGWLR